MRLFLCLSLLFLTQCRDEQSAALSELAAQGYALGVADYLRAAEQGDAQVLGLMLKAGMAVDVADAQGRRALEVASAVGQAAAVKLLLEHGAKVALGAQGTLRSAVQGKSAAVIQLLLEQRPQLKADAALHLVAQSSTGPRLALEALLTRAELEGTTEALCASAALGDLGCVDLLLLHGASPWDQEKETGRTALMAAAEQGHTAVVELLMNAGSSRFVADAEGRTAFDYAASPALREVLLREPSQVERSQRIALAKPAESASVLTDVSALPASVQSRLHLRMVPGDGAPSALLSLSTVQRTSLPCVMKGLQGESLLLEDERRVKVGEEVCAGWVLRRISRRPELPSWCSQQAWVQQRDGTGSMLMLPGLPVAAGPVVADLFVPQAKSYRYECQVGDQFSLGNELWIVRSLRPDRVIVERVSDQRRDVIRWPGR